MTLIERWDDAWTRVGDNDEGAPETPPPMPTMTQWALMFLITLMYWHLYHAHGPDACGEPDTEPRWTWDQGGSFWDGFHAMWGI